MKKIAILSAIVMSGLIYNTADAQLRIHLGFNFGTPRVYAPARVVVEPQPVYEQPVAANYDNNDDYYYLPDVDAYYSVNEQCYYYLDGDNWISAEYLPGRFHDYDWRSARRYEVRASRPYLHNDVYRSRYGGNAGNMGWAGNNYNNHSQGTYANAGRFNNEMNRGANQRFDNRGQGGYQPAQPNRGQGGYSQPAQPNRRQGDYQPAQGSDRGQGGYSQSAQLTHVQGNNTQRSDNRGQGGNSKPSGQNAGQAQANRGGNDHNAQNSPQGGFANHRMARF